MADSSHLRSLTLPACSNSSLTSDSDSNLHTDPHRRLLRRQTLRTYLPPLH
jgi:hypothetical protein